MSLVILSIVLTLGYIIGYNCKGWFTQRKSPYLIPPKIRYVKANANMLIPAKDYHDNGVRRVAKDSVYSASVFREDDLIEHINLGNLEVVNEEPQERATQRSCQPGLTL